MSAKELKAIADIGITLGYSGDELKQFVNDERMRMDGWIRRKNWKGSARKPKLRKRYSVKRLRNSVKWMKLKNSGNLSLRSLKQKEAELNAQREKEKDEFELQKLQLELNARVKDSQSNTSVDGSGDHAFSHVSNIKLMKLPPFHEEKDDLDA